MNKEDFTIDKGNVVSSKKEKLNSDLFRCLAGSFSQPSVNHFLCDYPNQVDPFDESELNFKVNSNYLMNKERYEKLLKEKDYDGILVWMSKRHHVKWFIKHYKKIFKDVGEDKYYELLNEIFTYPDYHYGTKKSYSRLINIGCDPLKMMSKKERKLYDKLPEKLIIYRGVSSLRQITLENFQRLVGNSWTLDKGKSLGFSTKLYFGQLNNHHAILTTEINKSQVLSYFTDRKEKEIFVDYEKLDYTKIELKVLD